MLERKCFYCGEDADTKDHIIPVAYYYGKRRVGRNFIGDYDSKNLVDCCQECNSIAGDKIFDNVYEKKDFIQQRLKFKYKQIINTPYWSDNEIKELGHTLKKEVKIQQLARKWVLNRVDYPNELYSAVKLTKEIAQFLQKDF